MSNDITNTFYMDIKVNQMFTIAVNEDESTVHLHP
jgi:hypothetical protein